MVIEEEAKKGRKKKEQEKKMPSPASLYCLCMGKITIIIGSHPERSRSRRHCFSSWREQLPLRLWDDVRISLELFDIVHLLFLLEDMYRSGVNQ